MKPTRNKQDRRLVQKALAMVLAAGSAGSASSADSMLLRADKIGTAEIVLSWNAPTGGSGLELSRKTGAESWQVLAELEKDATTFTDTNQLSGKTGYTYRLRQKISYVFDVIRPGQDPVPFDISLKGAGELALLTYGSGGSWGSQYAVFWVSPVLTKIDGTKTPLAALKASFAEVGSGDPKPPAAKTFGSINYPDCIAAPSPSRLVYVLDSAYVQATGFIGIESTKKKTTDVTFSAETKSNDPKHTAQLEVTTPDWKSSPGKSTYYVNAQVGDDAHSGTSVDKAWKSISRVNATGFQPGDKIFFAGGQIFKGTVNLLKNHSGTKELPLVVSSYGEGRATIDAGPGHAIVLSNCDHAKIRELKLTGCGRKAGSDGNGIQATNCRELEIDAIDVSGFRLSGVVVNGSENARLTHIYAHDNGSAGISTHGGFKQPYNVNLYIGHCVAENNPGDPKNLTNHSGNGIVVGGVKGGLIEFCEAKRNGWDMPRKGNGPVGIWGWYSDKLVIQYCISHDNESPDNDGGGFDFDGGITNSILQYNYSYNNSGSGYLLCSFGPSFPLSGNIVRYNISENDGWRAHKSGIHIYLGNLQKDTWIYNNVIINKDGRNCVSGDSPKTFYFYNNIFLLSGNASFVTKSNGVYQGNLYWNFDGAAKWENAATSLADWQKTTGNEMLNGQPVGLYMDPMLNNPGNGEKLTDPTKLPELFAYMPKAGSPLIDKGLDLKKLFGIDPGTRDLYGNPVPSGAAPDIGACELKPEQQAKK